MGDGSRPSGVTGIVPNWFNRVSLVIMKRVMTPLVITVLALGVKIPGLASPKICILTPWVLSMNWKYRGELIGIKRGVIPPFDPD